MPTIGVPNKVWRGGVHRTTPETTEKLLANVANKLPGCVLKLDGTQAVPGLPVYVLGEILHGGIDDVPVATDTQRLYNTHSGDLFTGRAAAGLVVGEDVPYSVNATGRLVALVADTVPVCFGDAGFAGAATADQRIAIKFK